MRVSFLGSGDAFCADGRGQSALLIEDGLGMLLVDCGATVPLALARLGVSPARLDAVLITHWHGDHAGGLLFLFLGPWFPRGSSRRPLTLAGPSDVASRLDGLAHALYPDLTPRWPSDLVCAPLAAGMTTTIAGRRVEVLAADHTRGGEPALSYRIHCDDRIIAVSGDTGPAAPLAELAAGTDLFVCECTLVGSQGAGEGGRPGHLTVADIQALRPTWRAARVALTHLSAASRAAAATLRDVTVADDGMVIEV
jgi:ribonuclease BN (tRNA processing enzyme)